MPWLAVVKLLRCFILAQDLRPPRCLSRYAIPERPRPAFGRKLPLKRKPIRQVERPLSVRPDIQAGPMSALRSEPDIRLEWQLKARSGHSQVLKPN